MLGVEKKVDFKPSENSMNMSNKPPVPNRLRLTRAKTSLKPKFKIPNEVERWALGQRNSKYQTNYDSDDFESIDDTYIRNLAINDLSENDKKEQIADKNEQEQQRMRIREMIKNLRRAKEIQKKLNKGFYGVLEQQHEQNQKTEAAKTNECSSEKLPEDEEVSRIENGNIKSQKKKPKEKSFEFRSMNTGMARAVPGSLQQNITVERTFFKELLDLSKQRYMYKLGADFKMRQFQARQERKGLLERVEKKDQTFEMPDFLSRASSTSSQTQVKNIRKFKSSSAFGVRHDEKVGSDEQIDVKKISRPKTNLKKEIRPQPDHTDILDSLKQSNESDSFSKIKISNDIEESPSQHDFDEKSLKSLTPKKQLSPLKPALKRPNTSLAVLSTIKTIDDGEFNRDFISNLKETFKSSKTNPTTDTRYKSLVDSMNKVYFPNKENVPTFNKLEHPSERVRNLIRSNKALQGAGWNGESEKEKKTRYELDSNKKLFEKAASDIF